MARLCYNKNMDLYLYSAKVRSEHGVVADFFVIAENYSQACERADAFCDAMMIDGGKPRVENLGEM